VVSACSSTHADYTTAQAENALNAGKSIDNKTVDVTVKTLIPNSAFGYNIEAGKHLNFVSSKNPNVKAGKTIRVKVDKVQSFAGSYIINYTVVK
jgi:predicted RNA-binding protein with TRAM domain